MQGFSRLGIGARLLLAFIGVTAVSLSSGFVGWFMLREVSQAQTRLSDEALPAVAATRRAADASARLVAATPALIRSQNESQRAAYEQELSALTLEIQRSASAVGSSLLDKATAEKLSEALDLLVSNLATQSRLIGERLVIEEQFARRSRAAIEAGTAIVDLSETLVSNASAGASAVIANLYGLVEDATRNNETYDALDRLIEQDIYQLDRMWELRLRSSQIALLVNRLTRAIENSEVTEMESAAAEHLRVVRRRVASIDDPVRRAEASRQLEVLGGAIAASPRGQSLFDEKQRLISIEDELNLVAKNNTDLSGEVGSIAEAMFISSEAFARDAASQANRSIGRLNALLLGSLVAFVLCGALIWLYVERGIVIRLRRLTSAMERLTAGDLDVKVTEQGAPELQALSNAVRAFHDESAQRRALEIEREGTNEALRRHREDLQVLVDERTRQLRDANERLRLEVVQHAEARELAESASRAKSSFLATMSHEIRTPMTGMLGMLRILEDSAIPAKQKRELAVAAGAGKALLGILDSILDYSKVESGTTTVDVSDFSLRDVLSGVADLMRPSASEKGLWMEFSCERRIWPAHTGDAGKLNQIVFNLVSNAIKFTQRGRVAIFARLSSADGDTQWIAISVTDTGIGISAKDQERVFEEFTQAEPSITRRFGGTGLGLAISRRLAEAMGGSLTVQSEPGRGSTFTLTVPLKKAGGERADTGVSARRKTTLPALNVLVVEDDDATRLVATSFLEKLGHRVILAEDGYEAVAAIEEDLPDLVLMDISLPGMDGGETMRRIRMLEGAAELPVLAMSAHVFKAEIDRYLAEGMNGYIAKPLIPEALEAAIARAMTDEPATVAAALDLQSFDADLNQLGVVTVGRILDAAENAIPGRFRQIRRRLLQGSLEGIVDLAHATQSSAGSAGLQSLHAAAQKLEEAARGNVREAVERHLAECEAAYDLGMREARRRVALRAEADQESLVANR